MIHPQESAPLLAAGDLGTSFICAMCGGTFTKSTPEPEALAELHHLFGDVPLEECAIVCQDCWEQLPCSSPPPAPCPTAPHLSLPRAFLDDLPLPQDWWISERRAWLAAQQRRFLWHRRLRALRYPLAIALTFAAACALLWGLT